MGKTLQVRKQATLEIENQPVTGKTRPIVSIVAGERLKTVKDQHHDTQRRQFIGWRRSISRQTGEPGAPAIDNAHRCVKLGRRGRQDIDDVLERKRKREWQRELAYAHQGRSDHQTEIRPDQTDKSKNYRLGKFYLIRVHSDSSDEKWGSKVQRMDVYEKQWLCPSLYRIYS